MTSPVEAAGTRPTSDARREILLASYAAERQYNNVALQAVIALIGAGFAYMGATATIVAGHCSSHVALYHAGCADVPKALLWAAPLPALGLIAFIRANQVVLELGSAYVAELERELDEVSARRGPDALVVPQGMGQVVGVAYRPPSIRS